MMHLWSEVLSSQHQEGWWQQQQLLQHCCQLQHWWPRCACQSQKTAVNYTYGCQANPLKAPSTSNTNQQREHPWTDWPQHHATNCWSFVSLCPTSQEIMQRILRIFHTNMYSTAVIQQSNICIDFHHKGISRNSYIPNKVRLFQHEERCAVCIHLLTCNTENTPITY